jgi:twinkle protein
MIIKNQYDLKFNENGHESQKVHCPKCRDERKNKTDKSLSVNILSRVFHCHHCGWSGRIDGWKKEENYKKPDKTGWSNFSQEVQLYFAGRKIGIETITKNKIVQKKFFDDGAEKLFMGFPYLLPNDREPVNVKWRGVKDKEFKQAFGAMRVMYNLPMWATEPEVVIVEGEIDVMSFNEAGLWNVTTLCDGAINEKDKSVDGKLTSFYNSFEWIENKSKVYLCLDDDVPGRRLRDELIRRIGAEKCATIKLPQGCKDPNQSLDLCGPQSLVEAYKNAKPVPISGIFYVSDSLDSMLDSFNNGTQMGERTHMGELDRIFRWKKGQINLWTGYANFGKTVYFLQCALVKAIMDGWKWAVFSPENYPAQDFYDDIIEMYVGKNVVDTYHNKMTIEDYLNACDFVNEHFIFIYPEENHTIESLHDKFSYLIGKHGIDGVMIDPYNQVEAEEELRTDIEISRFMLKAKRFAVKHTITYNIIAHPKTTASIGEKSKTDFQPADAYDVAGGAMWANKSDNILSIHRPNWFVDKKDPKTHIYSQKVKRKRTGGELDKIEQFWDFRTSRFYGVEATQSKYYCDPRRKELYQIEKESGWKPLNDYTEKDDNP